MRERKRVVVSGMGAVSSIGTGLEAIEASLRAGRSGISAVEEWRQLGMASWIAGVPEQEPDSPLATRRIEKSSSPTARMALAATAEALRVARLEPQQLQGSDTAVLIGSGTGSSLKMYLSSEALQTHHSLRRVHPYAVQQGMGSTAAANVSVALGVRGESWSPSSACSSGSHAIGIGALYLQTGRYRRVIAGGAEEVDWTKACAFDAMHALSRRRVERPQTASRPFDRDRDGFVISGGAGVLVLEELELALARQAPILAELIGWGSGSDGHDMVMPIPEGAADAMHRALQSADLAPDAVDYVNAHGTSTPQGDASEAAAMQSVFGARQPYISSTKSTTGHAIGAAGALEAIYSVLMLSGGFVAPSVNVEQLDEACAHLNLVTQPGFAAPLRIALSNSFGFGGTNSCLLLRRWDGTP